MMESGLEKYFEILPCTSCFLINGIYYIEKHRVTKSVIEMTFFVLGGISIKLFVVYLFTYHEWMFQISSIFNYDCVHQTWISGILISHWTYLLQILSKLCFQRVSLSENYEIVAISTDKNTIFNSLDYKADIGQHFHESEKSARWRHRHKKNQIKS